MPLVYVLATDKTQQTYSEREPSLNPLNVTVDLEMAAINAVDEVFPSAKIHACYFHFCRAVWKKLRSLGLKQRFTGDLNFASHIRMIFALAYVPVDKVVVSFDDLMTQTTFEEVETPTESEIARFSCIF